MELVKEGTSPHATVRDFMIAKLESDAKIIEKGIAECWTSSYIGIKVVLKAQLVEINRQLEQLKG